MTKRKFYRRVVTLEFISEEPYPEGMALEGMIFDARNGDSSMQELSDASKVVNGKQAAKILMNQGSDPSFFRLDENGNDVE